MTKSLSDGGSRREFLARTSVVAGTAAILGGGAVQAAAQPPPAAPIPNAQNWDIGDIIPGTNKRRSPDGASPMGNNAQRYRRINLMCYLLEGITYNELYGKTAKPVKEHLDVLIPKIEQSNLNKYFRGNAARRSEVLRILRELRQWLTDNSVATTHRALYVTPSNPHEREVLTRYYDAYLANEREFCLPFIFVDRTETEIEKFLAQYGCLSLYELFVHSRKSKPKNCANEVWDDALRHAAGRQFLMDAFREDLQLKILLTPEERDLQLSSLVGVMDSKCDDPNDHQCSVNPTGPDSCVTGGDCFCSIAEDQNCSLASCCG